ncbi:MAG: hypothetical protein ACFFD9_04330, partial [Candidatus Thorarchaeota archaeon]
MKTSLDRGIYMNAYFTIVLISIVLFFVVWGLGWLLERLSQTLLSTTRNPGSRSWYLLVGPGVALHESSHALGCVFTRTKVVEFKPINVTVQDDRVVLGYVRYLNPESTIKRAIINLAPVAVSLVLLIFFALGATYLVPESPGIGGEALNLLQDLIDMKSNPTILADSIYPLTQIGSFVYLFLHTFAGLTVISPVFWIVAFLAMTIMFSNAPSEVDIRNAVGGLKYIILFDLIWLVVAYFVPEAGWLLPGLFELIAVMFALALAFAAVAYGFFILVAAMARIRAPFQLIPILACLLAGIALWYLSIGTAAFQTVAALAIFIVLTLPILATGSLRA